MLIPVFHLKFTSEPANINNNDYLLQDLATLIAAGATDAILLNARVGFPNPFKSSSSDDVTQVLVGVKNGAIMVQQGDMACLPCPPWCPKGPGETRSHNEAIDYVNAAQ